MHEHATAVIDTGAIALAALRARLAEAEAKLADTEYQDNVVDKIMAMVKQAGNVDEWDSCPSEMVMVLIIQRDEARAERDAAMERVRVLTEAGRPVLEEAEMDAERFHQERIGCEPGFNCLGRTFRDCPCSICADERNRLDPLRAALDPPA